MPSFFYSQSICRVVGDVFYCGLQCRPLFAGFATLASLKDHLRFLGMYPYTFGALLLVLLLMALNFILAYIIASVLAHLYKVVLASSRRRSATQDR